MGAERRDVGSGSSGKRVDHDPIAYAWRMPRNRILAITSPPASVPAPRGHLHSCVSCDARGPCNGPALRVITLLPFGQAGRGAGQYFKENESRRLTGVIPVRPVGTRKKSRRPCSRHDGQVLGNDERPYFPITVEKPQYTGQNPGPVFD
jgi:hypothetical protein